LSVGRDGPVVLVIFPLAVATDTIAVFRIGAAISAAAAISFASDTCTCVCDLALTMSAAEDDDFGCRSGMRAQSHCSDYEQAENALVHLVLS